MTAAAPAASVIVCTRDRVAFLRDCLGSLEHQLPVDGEFEVVVVDNGSTDGTAPYLRAWAGLDPRRRLVVEEPLAGLSRARNRGVVAARGEFILFLDDDAIAPQGWVAAHLRSYDRSGPLDAVGGPIVLTWPAGRPAWATRRLDHWWSALDLGDQPRPFPRPHGPYGTNMSIRRRLLVDVGGFPVALGRRARSLMSGEDASLWARVWASNGRIWYEPSALVVHQVLPDKVRRGWIVRRGVAQGRTNARLDALAGPATSVRDRCRDDARLAIAGSRRVVTMAVRGEYTSTDVLDELARRAGHATAVAEHVRLRLRQALDRTR